MPTGFDSYFCCNKWIYVMMLNYVTWFMVMYRWIFIWNFYRYNACDLWYFNIDVNTVDFMAES